MPKLHRAKTVAWGLLRCDRWCMIVVSHWSKLAWQNMASLLSVVGSGTSHSMPQGGKPCHFCKKPPLVRTASPLRARASGPPQRSGVGRVPGRLDTDAGSWVTTLRTMCGQLDDDGSVD